MADIRPFRAIRPKAGLEAEIAALPYDVYNRKEAGEVVAKHPKSFLRIDRAETQFSDEVDTYADCVYQKAHDMLWEQIAGGEFVQEETPCYYIYRQIMNGRSQTGIVACASIDDYCNNVIKKHENTRADKEVDRIRHVDTCDAQTGPIFLAYRSQKRMNEIVNETIKKEAVYDFVSEDGIGHQVWIVDGIEEINAIKDIFADTENIYIADGHHRCASAVKVGLKRRSENPAYKEDDESNYFLSVLFPDEELMIMDYNRVVKDLNGYTVEELLEKLADSFIIDKMEKTSYHPAKKGEIGMYVDHTWYRLTGKESLKTEDPVKSLDVSLLQDYVLAPLFDIQDPKTDKRIDFVGGIRGLEELERRVNSDMKIAFAMYPTSIGELFAVADADMLMPPKSTWFEPKLRSGLFIHSLKQ